MARLSKGRRKVAMVKMSKKSNLQATFSKRRIGLFKKASELCTLCGAEIAIVIFSPGKKVFSFGHPHVEMVIDRFLTGNPPQNTGTMHLIEVHPNAIISELNMHLTQVLNELKAEKKRGEELTKIIKASHSQHWWDGSVEELSLPQLDELKESLEELKKKAANQAQNLINQSLTHPQFFVGSSSNGVGPLIFDPNSTSPQFFVGSSSTGGDLPLDPNPTPSQFFAGCSSTGGGRSFGPNQNSSQFFMGNSSNGGGLPFDPTLTPPQFFVGSSSTRECLPIEPNPNEFNIDVMLHEFNKHGYDNLGFGTGSN